MSWYRLCRLCRFEHATYPPLLDPATPTAVTLGGFSSQTGLWYNSLAWDTLQELNLLGFNLYRSEDLAGERELLNTSLLEAANSGKLAGFEYEYLDGTARMGQSYYYWLELFEIDGGSETFQSGPVKTPAWLFLPWLRR